MQTTDTVLMIEPVNFGFNAETAKNNYFQTNAQNGNTQEKALEEFNQFVAKLRAKKINVITVKDSADSYTPDSIFPNNWVSFDANGNAFLYPMFAENRRLERRPEVLEAVKSAGFSLNKTVDLSAPEKDELFLEGTGSIIFDHDKKLAYGSVSLRLNEQLFIDLCEKIGYEPVIFHSFQTANGERLPIYHTNVMMCVAEDFVVICLDCIDAEIEREKVIEVIKNSGKELIKISEEQMHQFAGNMLQLHNSDGKKFLIMSETAFKSLVPNQIEHIEKYCEIIYANLETIETNGGGSARCMLAEVFLPKV